MALRVLVVDDNALVAEATLAALRAGGHVAEAVSSGEEVLARYRRDAWDLVLTDVRLPGLSGWELLERLHALDPQLAVGVLTGWPPPAGEPSAAERGALFLLVKPVDPEELLRALAVLQPGQVAAS